MDFTVLAAPRIRSSFDIHASIIFHDDPSACKNNCAGCYLQPARQHYESMSSVLREGLRRQVITLFWRAASLRAAVRPNVITWAANSARQVDSLLAARAQNYLWDPSGPDIQLQISEDVASSCNLAEAAKCMRICISANGDDLEQINRVAKTYQPSVVNCLFRNADSLLGFLRSGLIEQYPNQVFYILAEKVDPRTSTPSLVQLQLYTYIARLYSKGINKLNVVLDYCSSKMAQGLPCDAGKLLINIHADGRIMACPYSVNQLPGYDARVSDRWISSHNPMARADDDCSLALTGEKLREHCMFHRLRGKVR